NGRPSYGAVSDGGIIDLGRRLSKYPTLLDVFRAQAIGEARAAATGQGDHQIAGVKMLAPRPAAAPPKSPTRFCRFPASVGGHAQPIVRPKVSEKFDYEGEIVLVIGRE